MKEKCLELTLKLLEKLQNYFTLAEISYEIKGVPFDQINDQINQIKQRRTEPKKPK